VKKLPPNSQNVQVKRDNALIRKTKQMMSGIKNPIDEIEHKLA